jgi:hypothetical protein
MAVEILDHRREVILMGPEERMVNKEEVTVARQDPTEDLEEV